MNIFKSVRKKYYDYIVHLGENCHFFMNFNQYFHFVDSTLFTWVLTMNQQKFLEVFNNPDLIFFEDFVYNSKLNMWHLKDINMMFHGRSMPDDLKNEHGELDPEKLNAEKKELTERLTYLKNKTQKYLKSDGKKLFTRTLLVNDEKKDVLFIKNLYALLNKKTSDFDLLVIIDKRFNEFFERELKTYKNIYIRNIKEMPDDFVERAFLYDYLGWINIFNEFRPKKTKKSNKKYKYESCP